MVRLVRGIDGVVEVDRSGRAHGRGAYLHPVKGCLDQARRRHALERALKGRVSDSLWTALSSVPEGA
jgi:predicted RNA-binding protein YlxR (DUF448 family)